MLTSAAPANDFSAFFVMSYGATLNLKRQPLVEKRGENSPNFRNFKISRNRAFSRQDRSTALIFREFRRRFFFFLPHR